MHDRGPTGFGAVLLQAEQGNDLLARQAGSAGAEVPCLRHEEPGYLHADPLAPIHDVRESFQIHHGHVVRPCPERVGHRDPYGLGPQPGDIRRHHLALAGHRQHEVERHAEEPGPPLPATVADHGQQRIVGADHLQDEQLRRPPGATGPVRPVRATSRRVAEPRHAVRGGGHQRHGHDRGRGSATPHGGTSRGSRRRSHRYSPAFSM